MNIMELIYISWYNFIDFINVRLVRKMLNHRGTVRLESDRLILRRFELGDVFDMHKNWASDDTVTKNLTWKAHDNVEKTRFVIGTWIKCYKNKNYYNWCIEEKVNNEVIGSINLTNIDDINESLEVGYCLSHKFWDKGIMTESLSIIIDFVFSDIKINRLTSKCTIYNIPSMRVLKKCGFIYEGTLRSVIKKDNDKFIDCKYYSLLRKDYEK